VFAQDVLACPCGGRRRVLAFITDLEVAAAILAALGIPATIPTFAPARAPPCASFYDGNLVDGVDDLGDGSDVHDADPPAWDEAIRP
jgi:hypothetical protein